MSIINGLNKPYGTYRFKKRHKNGFLVSNNDLQDEMTIEESIFASDNETLKVIFIYKTMEQKKDCLRHTKLLEIIAPD
jgi:ATP-binding cassette subfamily F protein uup